MSNYRPINFAVLAVGVGVLCFALLSVNFNVEPISSYRLTDYYFNYSQGYINRGLVGSIIYYFYGVPNEAVLQSIIPQFNSYFIRAVLLLFWLLLFIPLVRRNLTPSMCWLLVAFSVFILLAPIWRFENHYQHLDLYLLFCSLIALICLLKRGSLLMPLPLVLGILIHPLMLLFIVLFVVLIVHACLTKQEYFEKWKQWLVVFGIVFVVYIGTRVADDPNLNIALLKEYGYAWQADLVWLEKDFLYTFEHNFSYIYGLLRSHTSVMLLFFLFLVVPLVLSLLIAKQWSKSEYSKPLENKIGQLSIIQWLLKYDKQLLLAAGILWFAPTAIVIHDTYRVFILGYWSLGIVLIYLLWKSPVTTEQPPRTRQYQRYFLALFVGLFAYASGGAPLIDFPEHSPRLHQCELNCLSMLTENRLGNFYSHSVYNLFSSQLFPIIIDAKTLQLQNWNYRDYDIVDNLLIVPHGYIGTIIKKYFTVEEGQTIEVSIDYVSNGVPKIELVTANGFLETPTLSTPTKTNWILEYVSSGIVHINLLLLQQEGLAIKEVKIDNF